MKVKIIVVYFGHLPTYFPLWLKSCEYNPEFDFLLVTDDRTKYKYPSNVSVLYTSLSDIEYRIQQILQIKVYLNTPYKLCDYKVLYGKIFADELLGYTFWGHCDLDMIFGKLSVFLTEADFKNYDRIYQYGHLSLYRNCDKINNLYMKGKSSGWYDYKEVYSSKQDFAFDECGMRFILAANPQIRYDNSMYGADIRPIPNWISLIEHSTRDKNYKHQIFIWENGQIFQVYLKNSKICKKEYAYIHMQHRKMTYDFKTDVSSYYICSSGFVESKGCVDEKTVHMWNKYPGDVIFSLEVMVSDYKFQILRRLKRKVALYCEKLTKER